MHKMAVLWDADAPGIIPHKVHPEDRAVYWFYFFRMRPEAFRCGRSEFTKALLTEGIRMPTYEYYDRGLRPRRGGGHPEGGPPLRGVSFPLI